MTRIVNVLTLATALLAHGALAQAQLPEMEAGQRVRLEAPGVLGRRFEGTVISRTGDTLVVARSAGVVQRVPVGSITAAEVSLGKSRMIGARRGALWGAGIGTALGLLVGIPAVAVDTTASASDVASFTGMMAFGGAIWGVGIGAAIGAERWLPLVVPARVSVMPSPRGMRLALSLRY